jgi:hypothetical protein
VSETIIKPFHKARVVAYGTIVFGFVEAAITSKVLLFYIGAIAVEVCFSFANDTLNDFLV